MYVKAEMSKVLLEVVGSDLINGLLVWFEFGLTSNLFLSLLKKTGQAGKTHIRRNSVWSRFRWEDHKIIYAILDGSKNTSVRTFMFQCR